MKFSINKSIERSKKSGNESTTSMIKDKQEKFTLNTETTSKYKRLPQTRKFQYQVLIKKAIGRSRCSLKGFSLSEFEREKE